MKSLKLLAILASYILCKITRVHNVRQHGEACVSGSCRGRAENRVTTSAELCKQITYNVCKVFTFNKKLYENIKD